MNSKTKQLQHAMPEDLTTWLHFISAVVSRNFFHFCRQTQECYHNRFLPHPSQFIIQSYPPVYHLHNSRSAEDHAIMLYWKVNWSGACLAALPH